MPQLWDYPQINWEGKLLGCCVNYWDDYGNVFKSGFREAFNCEKMVHARKMLMGFEKPRADIACGRCHIYGHYRDRKEFLAPRETTCGC